MLATMKTLFPQGADWSKASYWAGLRPMTPEGTPILGPSRMKNLWFNTGQGHMGWTMSHGAARITADLMAGKRPAIPLEGMTAASVIRVTFLPQIALRCAPTRTTRENCRMKFMRIAAFAAVLGLYAGIWPVAADAAQTGMASYYKTAAEQPMASGSIRMG